MDIDFKKENFIFIEPNYTLSINNLGKQFPLIQVHKEYEKGLFVMVYLQVQFAGKYILIHTEEPFDGKIVIFNDEKES